MSVRVYISYRCQCCNSVPLGGPVTIQEGLDCDKGQWEIWSTTDYTLAKSATIMKLHRIMVVVIVGNLILANQE